MQFLRIIPWEKGNCDKYPYEKVATSMAIIFTALYAEEVR